MIYTYVATALVSAALAFGGAWKVQAWRYDAERLEIERAASARLIREVDRTAQIEGEKNAAIRETVDNLVSELDRLRKRPERIKVIPSTCAGTTGAELSGPDAGFLAIEAARADTLRAALGACYKHVDAVTKP